MYISKRKRKTHQLQINHRSSIPILWIFQLGRGNIGHVCRSSFTHFMMQNSPVYPKKSVNQKAIIGDGNFIFRCVLRCGNYIFQLRVPLCYIKNYKTDGNGSLVFIWNVQNSVLASRILICLNSGGIRH